MNVTDLVGGIIRKCADENTPVDACWTCLVYAEGYDYLCALAHREADERRRIETDNLCKRCGAVKLERTLTRGRPRIYCPECLLIVRRENSIRYQHNHPEVVQRCNERRKATV